MGSLGAPFVLLPEPVAARMQQWGTSWGWLELKHDVSENLVIISKFSKKDELTLPYTGLSDRGHYSRALDPIGAAGLWYRVEPVVYAAYYHALLRDLTVPADFIKDNVTQGWRQPPAGHPILTLTFSEDAAGTVTWSAWWLDREGAVPCRFDMIRDKRPLDFLAEAWPIDELAAARVSIIGAGSIGSAAAATLAASGIGHLRLIDRGRLRQHNVARHQLSERDIGRYKVNAMAQMLRDAHKTLDVEPIVADLAVHADLARPILADSDVIVCATDGVQSRQVANHLARRAGVPIVLAAVLEDGAYGELIRVQNRTGCLLCHRRTLVESGTFDPEPGLDQDYGTGSPHRPMTAAPHDLRLMGDLAAQAAIATFLERRGYWTHRLPGDWAIVGLQPNPEMPAPFDLGGPGDVRWLPLPGRQDGCPTCAPP